MSRASLEAALPPGVPIVVDTSVLLAYLNGEELASPAAAVVLDDFVRSGRNMATISAVTVTETLTRPFVAGPVALGIAEAFLMHVPNLVIVPIDYAIAREAARLRAVTSLRTPDALVIATAGVLGIPIVVTNDAKWQAAIATAELSLGLCHLDAHLPL